MSVTNAAVASATRQGTAGGPDPVSSQDDGRDPLRAFASHGGAALAPMSGVTDVVLRRIAWRFGATMVVSEMVASDDYARGDAEHHLRAEGSGISHHVVQLAGCEPHWMAEAARRAEAAGAAIIDINMGCPAKRVTNGWSGSALMRDIDHACGLIAATVKAVTVPVTLKMRLGWDDDSLNAPELARRAEDLGIRLVTVHARTRQQFYKGQARWPLVAPVRQATRLPLIVNGDIGTLADARAAMAASGANGVMVGRAAVGRPWLVGAIASGLTGSAPRMVSLNAMRDGAIAHLEGLMGMLGVAHGLRHGRKHVAAYLDEAARHGGGLCDAERRRALTADDSRIVFDAMAAAFCAQTTLCEAA
jgi:nifR3 family TIM-barrel protein